METCPYGNTEDYLDADTLALWQPVLFVTLLLVTS